LNGSPRSKKAQWKHSEARTKGRWVGAFLSVAKGFKNKGGQKRRTGDKEGLAEGSWPNEEVLGKSKKGRREEGEFEEIGLNFV